MKTINALLLFALIFAVNNSGLSGFDTQTCLAHNPTQLGGEGKTAYSLDFCRSTDYGSYYRCCFLKYEKNDRREYHCAGVSSAEFWDIDSTIDNIEHLLDVEIDSLDCSASYLYVSLLLIFALLF